MNRRVASAAIHAFGPSAPYVIPMAAFFLFAWLAPFLGLGPWEYPLRCVLLGLVLWLFSADVIDFRVRHLGLSLLLGVVVFVLWIGPDVLIAGYRSHWLFQNSILGRLKMDAPPELSGSAMALLFRTIRAAVLVPIIEELFWRAWLMRWLIDKDFHRVALGTYQAAAFAITALLFASEHGPYWEVGLLTGVIYNWWMVRTKSLGDMILVHGVTNACLSAYVIHSGKWEYWL